MVNIVTNGQPSSVTFNVDSGEISPQIYVQDSLVKMAADSGMVNTINDINNESYHTDQDLRDDYGVEREPIYQQNDDLEEEPEQEQEQLYQEEHQQQQKQRKKSPQRKSKGDKRFDDLIYKLGSKSQEAEEIAQQRDATARELKLARDEHAAYVLNVEKQNIEHNINRVTDIMVRAKETGQIRSEVDANRLMNELVVQESQTNAAINQLEQEREDYAAVPQKSEYEELAKEMFDELSDPREFYSPAYSRWLSNNTYYNPHDHENFDLDLAKDVNHIKRTFNKFLKHTGNADFIGTDNYYQEFDAVVKHKLYGEYMPPTNQNYSNRGYAQQERNDVRQINYSIDPRYEESLGNAMPEGQSRIRGTYPDDPGYEAPRNAYQPPRQQQRQGVAPVNRSGYNQQYQQQAAPLSEQERKLAIMMPMVDMQGRPLSEREKLQSYAADKANMNQNNRR